MKRILVLLFAIAITAPAAEWRLDAGHSKIAFTAESRFFGGDGLFRKFDVKADVDEKALEKSSVAITVDVTSIDTNNERRDKHLKSADFFDVEKHPTANIQIKDIRKISERDYEANADITIRGVTKPVKLPVKVVLFEEGRLRLRGTVELNRKDFGVSYSSRMNPIQDMVEIRYEIGLLKPKEQK